MSGYMTDCVPDGASQCVFKNALSTQDVSGHTSSSDNSSSRAKVLKNLHVEFGLTALFSHKNLQRSPRSASTFSLSLLRGNLIKPRCVLLSFHETHEQRS